MPTPETEPAVTSATYQISPRSPSRAAVCSGLGIGWGQLYNRQLEKAILLWIWVAILVGTGVILLIAGGVAAALPRALVRPPLGDWIADHAGAVLVVWMSLFAVLWGVNVRDAYLSAIAINAGRIVIRYPLRRQLVHVIGSQLLGSIPIVGFLFPPGIIAEAIDSARDRRAPDHQKLVREGGQALLEWALTRAVLFAFVAGALLWLLWWILRAFHLAP